MLPQVLINLSDIIPVFPFRLFFDGEGLLLSLGFFSILFTLRTKKLIALIVQCLIFVALAFNFYIKEIFFHLNRDLVYYYYLLDVFYVFIFVIQIFTLIFIVIETINVIKKNKNYKSLLTLQKSHFENK